MHFMLSLKLPRLRLPMTTFWQGITTASQLAIMEFQRARCVVMLSLQPILSDDLLKRAAGSGLHRGHSWRFNLKVPAWESY